MRVLIVEADRSVQALLAGSKHEITVAPDRTTALELARDGVFDVAILDWTMLGTTGVDVCRAIRQNQGDRHPYLILLTAKKQREDLFIGLEVGGDESLTKPCRAAEIVGRLRIAERFLGAHDALVSTKQRLAHMARHDALLPVLSRATLLEELHDLLIARRRAMAPLSLVRLDIRGFSRINDGYGHAVGDEVLKGVAARVCEALPRGVRVGRMGSDELVVVLEHADDEGVERVAESLASAVAATPITTRAGPIEVVVDRQCVTALSPAELDEDWMLSALDMLAAVVAIEEDEAEEPRDASGVFVVQAVQPPESAAPDTEPEEWARAV